MKRLAALCLGALAALAVGADPFAYQWEQLAPGVWAGVRDPFELPQEGNAVFVVMRAGVVVFDAGGSPAMGEAIVAQVRAVTDLPVTHVVISHWHGDHMRGLQAIRAAFPQAAVLAHPHTRQWIEQTRDRWLKRRVSMVPNIRKALDAALAAGQDLAGRPLIPEEKAWLEQGLANTARLDEENRRTDYVVPEGAIEDELVLRAGRREIRFFHPGDAHTAGDLIMWLPRERIVATGDVVTTPVPLMPSPYTGSYVAVLERIRALGFAALVPGHGAVQRDGRAIDLLEALVRGVGSQMHALVGQGLGEEAAIGGIDYSGLEAPFTHGDPFLEHRFQDYVAGAELARAAWRAENGEVPEEPF